MSVNYFLCKPHQYSTYMRYAQIDANAWNRMIASPLILANKAMAPLSIWGRMKETVEIDPTSGYPCCTAVNVGSLSALQVDVDNGCSIDEFVKCFHRYSFQLYTSYSYGVFKPGYRFRVIFPLKEILEMDWFVPPVKEYLIKLFDMCDISCFDKGHWQILPCISSKDAPYQYLQHQGEKLSFASENFSKMAEEYQQDAHWRREIRKADFSITPHAGALKKAQEIIDNAVEGTRNRTMYSVLKWLHDKVQVDSNEVYELTPPSDMDTEFCQMIVRIWGN